ncbi:type II secretion system F family protein [Halobaculum sp. CBA1158]|uniref:type II secretion system F family protein n=1 Tax=Halobaculum sp. CBA1158 TaxID=2904243 RepID=UPI001F201FEA|nr:type II secretion system F family protein [Halobaculum sp. CBA1158]UIP00359.1 type II secretion system F family protein [Halobaculum sp. CBA1158]
MSEFAAERDGSDPGGIAAGGVARADGTGGAETGAGSGRTDGLSVLDRALYALFSRHADTRRHALDRKRYRGAAMATSFDVYVARAYGLSWLACLAVLGWTLVVASAVPPATVAGAVGGVLGTSAPVASPSRLHVAAVAAGVAGTAAKYATVRLAGERIRLRTRARRGGIERTLPGAARFLHALSSGSDGPRAMLRRVADNDAYGETAVSVRTALTTASLTGSLNRGIGRVARDTPSRDALAPFLLKFREHAAQGDDALSGYLRLESRMLGHRGEQARERNADLMELVAELFVVLLVLPALFVIVLTVMSVLAPGLSAEIATPLGVTTKRAIAVYGAAAFVVVVGIAAGAMVSDLRPTDQRIEYRLPRSPTALLRSVPINPASAAVALLPVGGLALVGLSAAGVDPVNAIVLGYAAYALPVGGVALRRGRLDDAKDREISEFVHAVAGHVALGRPLSIAVDRVARDVDLGPLTADVADLSFALGLATGPDAELRAGALDRFTRRVGTPLAAQTIGLVSGALDAGSDADAVFETLQAEVGRLHHEKRALRANMFVYVAVGWTTALLVVGIVVAVNLTVLDGFADLASLSTGGGTLDPTAVDPERDARRFYVVAQATVFASGLFAGAADRGGYSMLLHSGALVTVCLLAFAVAGVI